MKKMGTMTKGAGKEQPSQGGRVMRQLRQEESVKKASKSSSPKKEAAPKGIKKGY